MLILAKSDGAPSHEVDYLEGDPKDHSPTWTVPDFQTKHRFTGLTKGTLYTVRVSGENNYEWSPIVKISGTPNAPSAAPSAPTNLAVTIDDVQLDLTWTVPPAPTNLTVAPGDG